MTKMKKEYIYGIIFIVALFVALIFLGVLKTASFITPPQQVNVVGNDVQWVFTVNANSIKDGVGFILNPEQKALTTATASYPVGTKVVPSNSVVLYFSRGSASCSYQLQKQTYAAATVLGIQVAPALSYYQLQAPQRTINVDVCADADCKTIDATAPNAAIQFTSSNGGTLNVNAQGALVSKQDCPTNGDVALYYDAAGTPKFYSQGCIASIQNGLAGINGVFAGSWDKTLAQGCAISTFVSGFNANPAIANGQLVGQMNPAAFGTGQVQVTGDAKYFGASFIVPAQTCNPKITNVVANDIQEDSSGTAKVTVSADNACQVTVTSSAVRSSIAPPYVGLSFTAAGSKDATFIVQCNSNSGADSVSFTACSKNDFGVKNCDTSSDTFNCVQATPSKYCGDNVCDASSGEDYNTCPKDCVAPVDPCKSVNPPASCSTQLDCSQGGSWLIPQHAVTTTSQSCVLGFIACKPVVSNSCDNDYTLLTILIIVIIASLILIYFMKFRRKK